MNSSDNSAISSGLNTIALKVGANTKNISFTIDNNDTNQSSLKKMASAINFAKTGVTASVSTDTKTGTSFLKMTSDKTGTENIFSISDVNGNAATASGASSITTQAQNAEYTLDGKQYTSQSNTISTDNGKVQSTPMNYTNPQDFSNFGSLTNNKAFQSGSFRSMQNLYSGMVVDTLL